MAEKIYTMDECMAYLRIEKRRTLYEMTCRGEIGYFKVGKENRFTQSQIDDYIKHSSKPSTRDIKREAMKYCASKPFAI